MDGGPEVRAAEDDGNLKEKIKREGEIERKIAERKLAGGRLPVKETSSRPRRACVARR